MYVQLRVGNIGRQLFYLQDKICWGKLFIYTYLYMYVYLKMYVYIYYKYVYGYLQFLLKEIKFCEWLLQEFFIFEESDDFVF